MVASCSESSHRSYGASLKIPCSVEHNSISPTSHTKQLELKCHVGLFYFYKVNTMPQGIISPEQKDKQKAALKEFHEKGKTGEVPTSSKAHTRPRKNKALYEQADRIRPMVPKAWDVLEDVLNGKEVDKQRYDVAKYTINTDRSITKDIVDHEAKLLQHKVDMEKAKALGAIPKEDPQEVARELASKGEHIKKLDIPTSWEEIEDALEDE